MQTTSKLLINVAHLLGWPSGAIMTIAGELETLAGMRNTLTITQEQVDHLTAEITANSNAIASAAQGIAPLKASIADTAVQIRTLIDKLAAAGVPFDTAALEAALTASTVQAKSISDSLTGAVVPGGTSTGTSTSISAVPVQNVQVAS